MPLYIVVYDLRVDKRRQKVHDLLKSYGKWGQYSTFEYVLSTARFTELRRRLRKLINLDAASGFIRCRAILWDRWRFWVWERR
ncbi:MULTISPECIES: CRISPR-associated endonuclease Cas2 [unclassified Microcoleus]|uniref:CRISPR-associated endonuclease Cas2 n=1 Tax=unclassified Microcoleus TaxID=2642155 RepID=UPI002FD12F5F